MKQKNTNTKQYAQRLQKIQDKRWKKLFNFFNPYKHHIKTACIGNVLEVGCGIGRVLNFIPNRSMGIDHNKNAVNICNSNNLCAFTDQDFFLNSDNYLLNFDTLLFSHVLEHMTKNEAIELVKLYLPYLKEKGRLVLITPQEKGFKSDETHVCHMDKNKLEEIAKECNIKKLKSYSFPFPYLCGKYFIYNENIFIGEK